MVCRSSSYCLLSTKGERKSVEGTLKLTERKEPLYQERHAIIQDYFEESPLPPPPPPILQATYDNVNHFHYVTFSVL